MPFILHAPFKPTGDQPEAIKKLIRGLQCSKKHQTLLGVTGSGKTFTMANVIAKINRPTLVISHNKTLAAQLASEFQAFFPKNEVHYFVSYYDYYQPEAYIPRTDTYIAKETQRNEEIERLRHASTQALLERDDVIIVASVSAIYGLGNPAQYKAQGITLEKGKAAHTRNAVLKKLNSMQYSRNDIEFQRGTYRVKGDVLEIFPAFSLNTSVRVEFFGDEIERIAHHDFLTGRQTRETPATHYAAEQKRIPEICAEIATELASRLKELETAQKLLEAQRLSERVRFDLEMMRENGMCAGIENYSRYFDGRKAGTPPFTLIDYFMFQNRDCLIIIDESHMTIPQIRGMYAGDRSRKTALIDYGFRLPSALDNRPLTFQEFESKAGQVIYASATPAEYELKHSQKSGIAEQLIRPTGLLDPVIDVRSTKNQIDNLVEEIKLVTRKGQRVLVTTLTKRIAEELDGYLKELGLKSAYLHSDVDTFERLEILRDLRMGVYDILVGINLLREGLDLPEVSLVAILDADKEGFLRSEQALIQTMGRAARHSEGRVLLYADTITGSMQRAMDETERRRKAQKEYNNKHGITPKGIQKNIRDSRLAGARAEENATGAAAIKELKRMPKEERAQMLKQLEDQMYVAAENLEFEKAATLRDMLKAIKKR